MGRIKNKLIVRNSTTTEDVTETIIELHVDKFNRTRWKIVDIDSNGKIVSEPRFYSCLSSDLASITIVSGNIDNVQTLWSKIDEIDAMPDKIDNGNGLELNKEKLKMKGNGWGIKT